MKTQAWGIGLLGVALLAGSAQASNLFIDFDSLASLTVVTNQYSGVTFSSSGGDSVIADNIPAFQDPAVTSSDSPANPKSVNVICSGVAGNLFPDCTHDIILTFSNPLTNVSSVSFDAFGNSDAFGATFATALVTYNNGASTQSVNLTVEHTNHNDCGTFTQFMDCEPDPQTLTFPNITSISIAAGTEVNGTAYDNFNITSGGSQPPPVPEPATLVLTGLVGVVLAGKRLLIKRRRT